MPIADAWNWILESNWTTPKTLTLLLGLPSMILREKGGTKVLRIGWSNNALIRQTEGNLHPVFGAVQQSALNSGALCDCKTRSSWVCFVFRTEWRMRLFRAFRPPVHPQPFSTATFRSIANALEPCNCSSKIPPLMCVSNATVKSTIMQGSSTT